VLRRASVSAPAGNGRHVVALLRLRSGRQRITVIALDPVTGFPARAVGADVRLRRD